MALSDNRKHSVIKNDIYIFIESTCILYSHLSKNICVYINRKRSKRPSKPSRYWHWWDGSSVDGMVGWQHLDFLFFWLAVLEFFSLQGLYIDFVMTTVFNLKNICFSAQINWNQGTHPDLNQGLNSVFAKAYIIRVIHSYAYFLSRHWNP